MIHSFKNQDKVSGHKFRLDSNMSSLIHSLCIAQNVLYEAVSSKKVGLNKLFTKEDTRMHLSIHLLKLNQPFSNLTAVVKNIFSILKCSECFPHKTAAFIWCFTLTYFEVTKIIWALKAKQDSCFWLS